MKFKTLSPSAINQYVKCPLQFKFHYEGYEGIAIDNEDMKYGGEIHTVVQQYFEEVTRRVQAGMEITPDDIERIFDETWKKGYITDASDFKQKSANIKENFVNFEVKRFEEWGQDKYLPTLVEVKLSSPTFNGIIDFYSKPMETVIDWKTGGMNALYDDHLVQGKAYQLILESNGYPVKKVLFVALSQGTVLEMPHITEGWLSVRVERVFGALERGEFRPSPSPLCNWCPFILRCTQRRSCLWL